LSVLSLNAALSGSGAIAGGVVRRLKEALRSRNYDGIPEVAMNPESPMPPTPLFPAPRPSAANASRGLGPVAAALLLVAAAIAPASRAATPSELLAGYTAQAGSPPLPARGQQLFTAPHGREWSCSSCHGALPTRAGKHASTGKAIGALAPAFNAERFTDAARTEKWFRRNCNDVMGRECTAGERADVLSWLLTLKP